MLLYGLKKICFLEKEGKSEYFSCFFWVLGNGGIIFWYMHYIPLEPIFFQSMQMNNSSLLQQTRNTQQQQQPTANNNRSKSARLVGSFSISDVHGEQCQECPINDNA